MNGYLVKFYKPFTLRNALFYKHSIQILHIRQADKFIDGSIITNITIQIRIGFSPLFAVIPNIATFNTSASFA